VPDPGEQTQSWPCRDAAIQEPLGAQRSQDRVPLDQAPEVVMTASASASAKRAGSKRSREGLTNGQHPKRHEFPANLLDKIGNVCYA
jgi:hypothetical protein